MNTFNKDINTTIFNILSIAEKYNFYIYCKTYNLKDELIYIKKYFDSLYDLSIEEWNDILINNDFKLPEELIEMYKDNLDWYIVCSYQKLTEDFIIKHKNYIEPEYIFEGNVVKPTAKLLDTFKDSENNSYWAPLSASGVLTEDLIIMFEDYIVWDYITLTNPTDEFLMRYKDMIKWYNINFTNVERYEQYSDYVDWKFISYNFELTEDFIRRNHDKLDWEHLSMHQTLSKTLINDFNDKVNHDSIEYNKRRMSLRIAPLHQTLNMMPLKRNRRRRQRESFFEF